jgi:predicted transcriptional regulator YdeE
MKTLERRIIMNYETVNLSQKTVSGLTIRTSNSDPNMTRDIGGLWQKFFTEDVYPNIPNKKSGNTIGLYTNYENGAEGAYDLTVCCEISLLEAMPPQFDVKTIPADNYAKFVLHGGMQEVSKFWSQLWNMELDRKFDCDFEEYQDGGDFENMDIYVYISLN